MATYFPPKRATAYKDAVMLPSYADPIGFQINPTLAAGDVKISKDFGAFANLTTLPSAPGGTRMVQVDASATEMTADIVVIQFVDQTAPPEWCEAYMRMLTTARQIDDLTYRIPANTALNNWEFLMVSSADGRTPVTGATVTATRSIDGAAFGACANAVSEVGNGVYKINLAAADLNGAIIVLRFTASGCDAAYDRIVTQ